VEISTQKILSRELPELQSNKNLGYIHSTVLECEQAAPAEMVANHRKGDRVRPLARK
jgi:hypothetical protein